MSKRTIKNIVNLLLSSFGLFVSIVMTHYSLWFVAVAAVSLAGMWVFAGRLSQ